MVTILAMLPGQFEHIFMFTTLEVLLELAEWLLRGRLNLSYYESPESRVKEYS